MSEKNSSYSNTVLNEYLKDYRGKAEDRSFIFALYYGTLSRKISLDHIIGIFSKVPEKKISPYIFNILRMSIYQLIYMDRVPAYAAINEAVNLAQKYGHKASRGFVNGVLRNVERNRESIFSSDERTPQYFSYKYSISTWIVEKWLNTYGMDFCEELLKRANDIPGFFIRENTLKTKDVDLEGILTGNSFIFSRHKYIDHVYRIENPAGIFDTGMYKDGYFCVKDPGSVYIAQVLGPKPGDLVIDVCSAPGGKTAEIGIMLKNQGKIVSFDINESRLKLVENEAERLGIENVYPDVIDALTGTDRLYMKADRVLVDAPCLGLGVMRRKPEIKFNKTSDDLKALTDIQIGILQKSSEYVKPGGVLVYSTCSITGEENMEVADRFLELNPDFEPVDFSHPAAGKTNDPMLKFKIDETLIYKKGRMQLFFDDDFSDGFFIAKFMRKKCNNDR